MFVQGKVFSRDGASRDGDAVEHDWKESVYRFWKESIDNFIADFVYRKGNFLNLTDDLSVSFGHFRRGGDRDTDSW
jgi:hypothetical protein